MTCKCFPYYWSFVWETSGLFQSQKPNNPFLYCCQPPQVVKPTAQLLKHVHDVKVTLVSNVCGSYAYRKYSLKRHGLNSTAMLPPRCPVSMVAHQRKTVTQKKWKPSWMRPSRFWTRWDCVIIWNGITSGVVEDNEWYWFEWIRCTVLIFYLDGLIQKRCNSSGSALELRRFCIKSSICRTQRMNNKTHYSDVIMSAMVYQITSHTSVYSAIYSGAHKRKHQSSASLAFVRGIHRSPHTGPITRKMFPLDDVIMNFYLLIFCILDNEDMNRKQCHAQSWSVSAHFSIGQQW